MAEWTTKRLGDLIGIKHGYAFKGEYFSESGPGPILLTPGNFAIGGGFKKSKPKYYLGPTPDEFRLKVGDLVITMTDLSKAGDTLGYSAIIPAGREYLHNQRIGLIFIKDSNKIDKSFLSYVLRTPSYRHHVLAGATGSTVRHTSPGRVSDYVVSVPSLEVQRSIAAVLGALDNKIALNLAGSRTTAELSSATFEASFENDESASLVRLEDLADIIDCLHSKKPDYIEGGRRYLVLADIRENARIDPTPNFTISEHDYVEWTRRFEAHEGDCIMTNVGRVGAVGQIPRGVTAAIGRNMTGVRGRNSCPPAFLFEALRSSTVRGEIEMKADQGTIMAALNVRTIPDLMIPAGTVQIRNTFQEKIGPLHRLQDQLLLENVHLERVRDTLLPKLMSGEIRVRDAEKVVEDVT